MSEFEMDDVLIQRTGGENKITPPKKKGKKIKKRIDHIKEVEKEIINFLYRKWMEMMNNLFIYVLIRFDKKIRFEFSFN